MQPWEPGEAMPGPGPVTRGVLRGVPVLGLGPDPSAGSTRAGAAVPAPFVYPQNRAVRKGPAMNSLQVFSPKHLKGLKKP